MSGEEKKPGENQGEVRHDARGNAVWQWAVDSGKQALDSTSRLLKRLEVPGLKLEGDTGENKAPRDPAKGKGASAVKPDRQAGYNPYGPTSGAGRPAGAQPSAATKPAAGRAPEPSLWQRLFRRR